MWPEVFSAELEAWNTEVQFKYTNKNNMVEHHEFGYFHY